MTKRTVITGAEVVFSDGVRPATLVLEGGRITDILPPEARVENAVCIQHTGYVLPGFVEIHAHGGGGYDIMDMTDEAFCGVLRTHLAHGTTTLCPTAVSAPLSELERLIALYRRNADKEILTLGGLHLEGPFLSQEMKGAQNPACLLAPTEEAVGALFALGEGVITRMTAAPELDSEGVLARYAERYGVRLAIGHSNAVAAEAIAAFSAGYTHITHMYCNTPSNRKIGQRVYAGVVEAAYLLDGMSVELIGDGRHIPRETMQAVLKIKGADRVALVSDAMRAAGTDVSESYLGAVLPENRVIIEDRVAKLPDRSFYAGSIATSDRMLRVAVLEYDIPLAVASRMMSATPAAIAGLSHRKGKIAVGMDADLVLTDHTLCVKEVLTMGRRVC